MKLLDRTLVTLLFSAIVIAGVSSVTQYFWVKNKIENRVDSKLIREKKLIKEQLKDIEPEEGFSYNTDRANVRIVSKNIVCKDSIFNGKIPDEDGELSSYRILSTCIQIQNTNFRVEIRKEIEETKTFIQSIFFTFFNTLLVVVVLFIVLKYFLLKNTWNPFFETLEKLKKYDFQYQQIEFNEEINIKEFKDLNEELNTLADKIYGEYQSQKIFTENVNHELMTPLAIIRGKLELLIQSKNLKENDLKLVSDIFMTIDRLTKLNKSLVLLSKIDNHQFEEKEEVFVLEMINDILDSFEDQIRVKNLKIRKQFNCELSIEANEMLMYVLFANLLKNAIIHNYEENGYITITIKNNEFEILNSGNNSENFHYNIFDRFTKNSDSEDSIGLGLSIVQKICAMNNIKIKYIQGNNTHSFQLSFNL